MKHVHISQMRQIPASLAASVDLLMDSVTSVALPGTLSAPHTPFITPAVAIAKATFSSFNEFMS
jgi:hypothetical protein